MKQRVMFEPQYQHTILFFFQKLGPFWSILSSRSASVKTRELDLSLHLNKVRVELLNIGSYDKSIIIISLIPSCYVFLGGRFRTQLQVQVPQVEYYRGGEGLLNKPVRCGAVVGCGTGRCSTVVFLSYFATCLLVPVFLCLVATSLSYLLDLIIYFLVFFFESHWLVSHLKLICDSDSSHDMGLVSEAQAPTIAEFLLF